MNSYDNYYRSCLENPRHYDRMIVLIMLHPSAGKVCLALDPLFEKLDVMADSMI